MFCFMIYFSTNLPPKVKAVRAQKKARHLLQEFTFLENKNEKLKEE